MDEAVLFILDKHPITGSFVLIVTVIVQQYLSRKKGSSDVAKYERETNKLARQTSATVNRCSERTSEVMDSTKKLMEAIGEHLEKDDIGHLHTKFDDAIRLLAKMGEHQGLCISTLDRVGTLCRNIADDLQQTNSQLVHEQIQGKLAMMEAVIKDVKRIVLSK